MGISLAPASQMVSLQTIALTLNYTARSLGLNLYNPRGGPTAQLDQDNPDADPPAPHRPVCGDLDPVRLTPTDTDAGVPGS